MEEYIKKLLQEVHLRTKIFPAYDPYDNFPDSTIEYYWDEYRNEWTLKERALEGYILSKILPIIRKEISKK